MSTSTILARRRDGELDASHLLVFINYATMFESLMSAGTTEDVELLERERRGALTSNLAEAGGFVHTRAGSLVRTVSL